MVFIIFCPFFLKFSLHNSEDTDFPPPFFYFLGNIFLPSFILSLTGFIVGSFRSPLGTRDMHLLGLLYLPSMSGIFSLIPCPCILFSTSLCVISSVYPYPSQRLVTVFYGFLAPTPVSLPGKFHGQRNLADYSPWGCEGTDMTEQLSMHTV